MKCLEDWKSFCDGQVLIGDLVAPDCPEQGKDYRPFVDQGSGLGDVLERLTAHADEIERGIDRYAPRDYGLKEPPILVARVIRYRLLRRRACLMQAMEITLKTLTPLWTGGVDQTCDRLHETGLLGSLRWWYEALVRGLGGYACDPTEHSHCEYNAKDPRPPEQQLCAACYLFGCTSWGRKFRLRVVDEQGQIVQNALQRNQTFQMQFLELRQMTDEERWLLAKAVEIAARYGAMGGKITSLRKEQGLVKLDKPVDKPRLQKDAVRQWLRGFRRVKHEPEWADLRYFIFVPNKALSEDPRKIARRVDPDFLLGQKKPERSRKIFVFKRPDRTFAYFRSKETYQKVLEEWGATFGSESIKTGEEVLNDL